MDTLGIQGTYFDRLADAIQALQTSPNDEDELKAISVILRALLVRYLDKKVETNFRGEQAKLQSVLMLGEWTEKNIGMTNVHLLAELSDFLMEQVELLGERSGFARRVDHTLGYN